MCDHDHHHAGHGHRHHGAGHGHAHAPAAFGTAFAIGIALNLGFVAVEALYGYLADSVALVADAGHNLSDVLGLAMAWGAVALAKRPPSARFTYGLSASSILAALFNGLLLLAASGAIAWEAARRLMDPPAVAGGTVMLVAAAGIVVNGATALMFARGGRDDINIRGAFLHMAADAAVSAGVVVSGLLTARTGLGWIDPATSLAVVAVILFGTWGLLREAVLLALGGVPSRIDPAAVTATLEAVPGVLRSHHLHIWPTSTTGVALTAHLVAAPAADAHAMIAASARALRERFGIGHVTLQVEDEAGCGEQGC